MTGAIADGASWVRGPLFRAPQQGAMRVVEVLGGSNLRARIEQVGISPGSTIRVRLLGSFRLVRTSRKKQLLCLGREVCEKIIVQKERGIPPMPS